jgi:hypothetical protein
MDKIAKWDNKKCTGSCIDDPVPDASQPDSEAQPDNIKTETIINNDGSKTVNQTTTYSVDGDTYEITTTTNYDIAGNVTSTSTSTTNSPSEPGEEPEPETFTGIQGPTGFSEGYAPPGEFNISTRFNTFLTNVKSSGLFSFSSDFFESLPGGGSPVFQIDGGNTFGTHTIDLSDTMSGGLAVLKTILLACFGFLSIRAVIMKR